MKLLFSTVSDPKPKTYPFQLSIELEKNKGPWDFRGKNYNTIPEFVIAIERGLLPFGISDFQCFYPDPAPDAPDNKTTVKFCFRTGIDYFQFQAIVLGDREEDIEYSISSDTPQQARSKAQRIHSFATLNEITASVYQIDPLTIKVVTNNRLDHVAIAIQNAKGGFDKPSTSEVMFNGYLRPFLEPFFAALRI